MTSGILVALAFGAIAVGVLYGLFRQRTGRRAGGDSPNTVAQWTEGETTRLLSSAELPDFENLANLLVGKPIHIVEDEQWRHWLRGV